MGADYTSLSHKRGSGINSWLISSLIVGLAAFIPYSYLILPKVIFEQEPKYTSIILSYDPLIIYIENFLSKRETDHLKKVADPVYERSRVSGEGNEDQLSEARTSSTAILPRNDTIVRRVMKRAAKFQGFVPIVNFESLQATKYVTGQQYVAHYDQLHDNSGANGTANERITTIFAILDDNCVNCGTQFPLILIDWAQENPRWCRFVDCNEEKLTVKPITGNAVFWKNLRDDGTDHEDSLHAGLPLQNGTKIGLNIWTRTSAWAWDDEEDD